MDTDVAKLPSDIETLRAMVAEQSTTIGSLTSQLAKLQHYVEQLLRARYGPRGERLDPNQLVLFDTTRAEEEKKTSQPTVVVKQHERRGGGRQELPDSLERQVVEHDLAEDQKQCPGCGTQRPRIGCEESEQLEYVPPKLFVLRHRRWKYACRRCQEHVAIARPAAKPIEKGLPGPGLLSALVTGKYSDHRVQGEAMSKMREGLSWPGDRTRPQTSSNCGGQEPSWETSGAKGAARPRQVRSVKSNASEPLMTCRNSTNDVKTGEW